MNFFVNKDGNWMSRVYDDVVATVDFSVEPTIATLPTDKTEYKSGQSMFKIDTNDKMALYTVAVDTDGTVAFMRYQLEYKLDSNLFNLYRNINAIIGRGVFGELDKNSSIGELLECVGVQFKDGKPQQKNITNGRFGNGGWLGNYAAITNELIGTIAFETNSLINWNGFSGFKYRQGIDENNFFGIDALSSATTTVQNSIDTISGATVRISRESTAYQRALVEAGILTEDQVIIGRF